MATLTMPAVTFDCPVCGTHSTDAEIVVHYPRDEAPWVSTNVCPDRISAAQWGMLMEQTTEGEAVLRLVAR